MSFPDTLVVGAGVAGLGAALLLARAGTSVTVWEGESEAGGLLAPIWFRGLPCDRGSHRVDLNPHSVLWQMTRREAWRPRPRRGRLILGPRRVRYPPRPLDLVRGLGPKAALSLARELLCPQTSRNSLRPWVDAPEVDLLGVDEGFEAFVRARVGSGPYERFYRPYVEKVWGAPPDQLSRSLAKQRLVFESPLASVAAMFTRRQPQFLYPAAGMSSVIEGMRRELLSLGVPILYRQPATLAALSRASQGVILYSGHLDDLVPDLRLDHRGLYLLHLAVDERFVATEDTFYSPDADLWFGRVSRLDRFSPNLAPKGEAILCVEIPDGRFGAGQDFLAQLPALLQQLEQARILRPKARVFEARQTHLCRVYPLYLRRWWVRWRQALERLVTLEPRLLPIGRQGLFLHCNLDQALLTAAAAVEHVRGGGGSKEWVDRAASYLQLRVRD